MDMFAQCKEIWKLFQNLLFHISHNSGREIPKSLVMYELPKLY